MRVMGATSHCATLARCVSRRLRRPLLAHPCFSGFNVSIGRRLLSTAASSGAAGPLCLVRDFIHDSLYHPSYGYFSSRSAPVGMLRHPLDFYSLHGQRDYFARVQQVYQELQVAWLTPVEIFQPHYGSAVAQYIVEHLGQQAQRAQQPLRLYEIGGGTGTLACNILDWLREHHPSLYASCHYTCVEISHTLAQLQQQRVVNEGGHGSRFDGGHHPSLYASCHYTCVEISHTLAQLQQQRVVNEGGHGSRFDVVRHDAASAAAWGEPSDKPCYIIMMEVLDNLAHDRVWRPYAEAPWQQTLVETLQGGMAARPAHARLAQRAQHGQHHDQAGQMELGQALLEQHVQPQEQQQQRRQPSVRARWEEAYQEVLAPASDPLVLRCLRCLDDVEEEEGGRGWGVHILRDWVTAVVGGPAEGEAAFLPTGCLQLLDTLHELRPAHHLIAADFDMLPEVVIQARNAPLVATTAGGFTLDHPTYLVPKGTADIFFPTDFRLLQRLYADAAQQAWHGGKREQEQGSSSLAEPAGQLSKASVPSTAGQCMKTPEFMRQHADLAATTTQSGYNPLLEDYCNTAFFLGSGSRATL